MTDAMLPRERCDYSAIVDRVPLKLPGGARLVLWTIVNYEVWDIAKPMARQVLPAPTGQPQIPDVPNWSWHEYGMRVGAWRFFDLFERLNIQPTLAVNARVCEDYPRGADVLKRAIDQFDRLYLEGKQRAKIMALAIHPYISGQPHRIKYLEAVYEYAARFEGVLHWNGLEILEWYQAAQR